MAKVNVDVTAVVNALLRPGNIDDKELLKALTGHLQKLSSTEVIVNPDITIGTPRNNAKIARQLRKLTGELENVVAGNSSRLSAAFEGMGDEARKALAAGLQGLFSDAEAILSRKGLGASKLKGFARQRANEVLKEVLAGNDQAFAEASARTKANVLTRIEEIRAQERLINSFIARRQKLGQKLKAIGKDFEGDKLLGLPLISLPELSAAQKQIRDRLRILDGVTNLAKKEFEAEREALRDEEKASAVRKKRRKVSAERGLILHGRDKLKSGTVQDLFEKGSNKDLLAATEALKAREAQIRRIQGLLRSSGRRPDLLRRLDAELENTVRERQLASRLFGTSVEEQRRKELEKAHSEALRLNRQFDKNIRLAKQNAKKQSELLAIQRGRAVLSRTGVSAQTVYDLTGKADLPDVIAALKARAASAQAHLDTLTPSSAAAAKVKASIAKTNTELKRATRLLNQTTEATTALGEQSIRTGSVIRQFFRYAIGYGILYQGVAAVRALTRSLVELDDELHNIKAVTASTNKEMQTIEASIKRTALTTKFSVTEIAKAGRVLVQAGVGPENFDSALQSVAQFASATSSSIEVAADLVSTMRNVFTELNDASIANLLTKSINVSKLTAEDLKVILSIGAQIGKSYNLSADQFLAAASTLRNAGLKASTVATGFRQGLIEIFSPDSKTVDALVSRYKQLGENLTRDEVVSRFFSFTNAKNPLVAALRELDKLGFTGSGKKLFGRVFDVRAANAISALIDRLSELEGTTTKLDFGASAAEASRTQMESLANSAKNLGAAFTTFSSELAVGPIATLEQLADAATNALVKLTDLQKEIATGSGTGGVGSIVSGSVLAATGAFALGGGGFTQRALRAVGAAGATGAATAGGLAAASALGFSPSAIDAVGKTAAILIGTLTSYLSLKSLLREEGGLLARGGLVRRFFSGAAGSVRGKGGLAGSLKGLFEFLGKAATAFKTVAGSTLYGRALSGLFAITSFIASVVGFVDLFAGDEAKKAKRRAEEASKRLKEAQGTQAAIEATIAEFDLSQSQPGTSAAAVSNVIKAVRDYRASLEALIGEDSDKFKKVSEELDRLNKLGGDQQSAGFKAILGSLRELTGIADLSPGTVSFLAAQRATALSGTQDLRSEVRKQILANAETPESRLDAQGKAVRRALLALPAIDRDILTGVVVSTQRQFLDTVERFFNQVFEKTNNSPEAKRARQRVEEARRQFVISAANSVTATGEPLLGARKLQFQAAISGLPPEQIKAIGLQVVKDLTGADLSHQKGPIDISNLSLGAHPALLSQVVAIVNKEFSRAVREKDLLRSAVGGEARTKLESLRGTLLDPRVARALASDKTDASQRELVNGLLSGRIPLTIDVKGKPVINPDLSSALQFVTGLQAELQKSTPKFFDKFVPSEKKLSEIAALKREAASAKRDRPLSLLDTGDSNPIRRAMQAEVALIDEEISFRKKQLKERASVAGEEKTQTQRRTIAKLEKRREDLLRQGNLDLEAAQKAAQKLKLQGENTLIDLQIAAQKRAQKAAEIEGDQEKASAIAKSVRALQEDRLSNEQRLLELGKQDASVTEATILEKRRRADAEAAAAEVAAAQARLARLLSSGPTSGSRARDARIRAGFGTFTDAQQREFLGKEIGARQALVASLESGAKVQESLGNADKAATLRQRAEEAKKALDDARLSLQLLNATPIQAAVEGFNTETLLSRIQNAPSAAKHLGEEVGNSLYDGFQGAIDLIRHSFLEMFDRTLKDGKGFVDQMKALLASIGKGIAGKLLDTGINLLFQAALGAVAPSEAVTGGRATKIKPSRSGGTSFAATGGIVVGPGTGTSDSVHGAIVNSSGVPVRGIALSKGEGILTAAAVQRLGEGFVHAVNNGLNPIRAAVGGVLRPSGFASSGGGTVVNYTSGVSVTLQGADLPRENIVALDKLVRTRTVDIIKRESRPGGLLDASARRR